MNLENYQEAFEKTSLRAEVNAVRQEKMAFHFQEGRVISSGAYEKNSYYLRAGEKSLGYVYTENPQEPAEELLSLAAALGKTEEGAAAEGGSAQGYEPLLGEEAPLEAGFQGEPEGIGPSIIDLRRAGEGLEALLREKASGKGAKLTGFSIEACREEKQVLNTFGLHRAACPFYLEASADFSKVREDGRVVSAEVHYRTNTKGEISCEEGERLAEKGLYLLESIDGFGAQPMRLPSGRYPAILSGQVMRNLLMTAWRSFDKSQMLEGKSWLSEGDIGKALGGKGLYVMNAPSHPLAGKSFSLDAEGCAVGETALVKEGVFQQSLNTLKNHGLEPLTGSAGRIPVMTGNPSIRILTQPALFYLRPGEAPRLSLDRGVVVTYSLDLYHSVNVAEGTFSIPCGGYYVEGKEPRGSLQKMLLTGRLSDLFGGILEAGADLEFDDFYFKNYMVGSPSVRCEGLDFSV